MWKCASVEKSAEKIMVVRFFSVGAGIFAPKCGKLAKNGTCKIL